MNENNNNTMIKEDGGYTHHPHNDKKENFNTMKIKENAKKIGETVRVNIDTTIKTIAENPNFSNSQNLGGKIHNSIEKNVNKVVNKENVEIAKNIGINVIAIGSGFISGIIGGKEVKK
jgi:hypothetical protein